MADVFENFRSLSLKEYKLDPCHYYSAPGLSWDACLKLTKAKIPTLFDRDIHDMIQSGIRGGVSVISHRYAKANNQQVPDYDPKIAPNNLVYIDANNLYGFSMSQDLPCDEFEWHEDKCWNSLEHKFKCTNGYGYILEVDLEYPDSLHDEHNDFPLAPENITIPESFLSDYNKSDNKNTCQQKSWLVRF